MDTKKMTMAWLGAFVVMFMLSFVWHVPLMGEFNAENYSEVNLSEEEFSFALIAAGYLVLTFLMSYIFPLGFKGGSAVTEGMRFGVLLGMTRALPIALILAGAYKMPLSANLVEAVYTIVESAIGGIVIAKIYGLGEGNDASSETDSE